MVFRVKSQPAGVPPHGRPDGASDGRSSNPPLALLKLPPLLIVRPIAPSAECKQLPHAGEVERSLDVLAVRGENLNGGIRGINIARIIFEPDLPSDEAATIPVIGAVAA